MCIIIDALKKKHAKKKEIMQAMKRNAEGFFMAALKPDGSRLTIRTLDVKEAEKFFDTKVKDDDRFVMHARITSRGNKNAFENIHGWSSDGITFMHNGTLSDLDSMMEKANWKKTDSEFFFRRVFIPYYRSFGKDAYKDGKFHPDIDNFISHFLDYTKFLFLMPDNKTIRYGNWVSEDDRKEGDEVAFWASNDMYVPEDEKISKASKSTVIKPYKGYYGNYFYDDDEKAVDDYFKNQKTTLPNYSYPQTNLAAVFDGTTLFELAGVNRLLKLAVRHLAVEGVLANRELYTSSIESKEAVDVARQELFPTALKNTYYKIVESFQDAAIEIEECKEKSKKISRKDFNSIITGLALSIAHVYEMDFVKERYSYAIRPTSFNTAPGLEEVEKRLDAISTLLNLAIDFDAKEALDAIAVIVPEFDINLEGITSEIHEMAFEDIFTIDTYNLSADDVALVFDMILENIREEAIKEAELDDVEMELEDTNKCFVMPF